MTDATEKVVFASPAWVNTAPNRARGARRGAWETGKSFSVCEVFTDAPPGMAGADATTAAWHVRIVDKTVTVGGGEIVDADLNVRVDYGSVLPLARLVYSPEMLAQIERNPPQIEGGSLGDQSKMPPYLVELHNRLAAATQ